ncbi:MAG TPA: hypothetical protein VGQ23_11175 [Burkholderiaceae bacterium]|jgi:hypothetical protein|nr:hypothetical protein [Burkholderiaceae bacterium]
MKVRIAYPLVAVLSAATVLLSLHPGAEAAPPERPAIDCAAPRESAPVADDPQRPLDPRDPQFAQKQAQRYRQWVR